MHLTEYFLKVLCYLITKEIYKGHILEAIHKLIFLKNEYTLLIDGEYETDEAQKTNLHCLSGVIIQFSTYKLLFAIYQCQCMYVCNVCMFVSKCIVALSEGLYEQFDKFWETNA